MTILVVDTGTFCAHATRRIVHQAGHSCEIAKTAVEAMRHLMFRNPCLVLTDVDLDGDEQGIDLLLWMQSAGIEVPSAVMTQGDEEAVREALDRAGLEDVEVLTKPVRHADLLEIIELCVPQPHARSASRRP